MGNSQGSTKSFRKTLRRASCDHEYIVSFNRKLKLELKILEGPGADRGA